MMSSDVLPAWTEILCMKGYEVKRWKERGKRRSGGVLEEQCSRDLSQLLRCSLSLSYALAKSDGGRLCGNTQMYTHCSPWSNMCA